MSWRQDWDFVTMADYQADMKESGDLSAGIIQMQALEITQLKTLICAIIHAAGHPIRVPIEYLDNLKPPAIVVEESPGDNARIFRPLSGRAER
jgi:hypothetical protein